MNTLYYRLVLLATFIIAAVGCLIYQLTVNRSTIETGFSPESVLAMPIEGNIITPKAVNWYAPEEQSTGWIYDVFTPPKIYLDENGQFVNQGWKVYLPTIRSCPIKA